LQMAGALAPKKKEGTRRKEFTHADDMWLYKKLTPLQVMV
jgi:hypothetical protein